MSEEVVTEYPLDNTDTGELECAELFYVEEYPRNGVYCNRTWDRISCWPTTPVGSLAILSCPSVLNAVKYDTSKNASRFCSADGHWNNYSDYTACVALTESSLDETAEATSLIYYTGYAVSLVALTIALWIFLYFKDLRCMRNTFHANLMITYVLVDLTWIIYASLQHHTSPNNRGTCVVAVFLHYFQGTNFFWMFVEGFYLYMLVVRTFTVDKVKCKVYLFLGWGVPAIVVLIWAIVKWIFAKGEKPGCAWMHHDEYDYIFLGPLLSVLIINLLFLGKIMWVLITKLRATTAESQQYRKAAKALLVLIPLLGVTYILLIVAPSEGIAFVIINYLRAFLLSTQGLTVSILYCFLNGEVKNTLRHHIERWKESHSFGRKTRYSCRFSRDESPRSGTESIRLYSAVHTDCRCEPTPRESCVSCLTTHSYVGNGHSKGANNDTNAKSTEGSSSNPIRENVAQSAPIKCF